MCSRAGGSGGLVMTKMMTKTVLNLRSSPEIVADNVILSMPLAQEVEIIDDPADQRFWEVETIVDGESHHGFASARFLRERLSERLESLLTNAVQEWTFFKHGDGQEHKDPFFK